jgi:hypothetical protein
MLYTIKENPLEKIMARSFEELNIEDENASENNENSIEYISEYKNETNGKQSHDEESEHLYWRPVVNNLSPLNKHLRWILKEENFIDEKVYLTIKDIGFFKGLKAAGIQDADKVIEAIEKYGYIELYEQ